jgi:hypothetical protein
LQGLFKFPALWSVRAGKVLKHHLNDFTQVAFFDAQGAENEFVWHYDTLKYRFIKFTKVVFLRRPEVRL